MDNTQQAPRGGRPVNRPANGGSSGGKKGFLDDYITVQDRINEFYQKYPDGGILTFHESDKDNWTACRYRAEVRKFADQPHVDATGWAFEMATGTSVNKTSHEENCETSAIGRALANLNFATKETHRASREEMEKVQRMQEAAQQEAQRTSSGKYPDDNSSAAPAPQAPAQPVYNSPGATQKQQNFVKGLWKGLGYVRPDGHHDDGSLRQYCLQYWNTTLDQMDTDQAGQLIDALQAIKAERDKKLENDPAPVVDEDGVILEELEY